MGSVVGVLVEPVAVACADAVKFCDDETKTHAALGGVGLPLLPVSGL